MSRSGMLGRVLAEAEVWRLLTGNLAAQGGRTRQAATTV
jgi:hypothetical protein